MKLKSFRVSTIIVLAAAACSSGAPDKKITITGASTIAPVMVEIGKIYEKQHPGSRVDVQTGGSSRGAKDTTEGLNDIGLISRPLKPEESELVPYVIARDGIAMIVHSKNPVTEITRQQVIDIYTGKITNWSALGGPDQPISVIHKAEGRSTLELFLEHFKLKAPEVKAHVIVGDNLQDIKSVAVDPSSIGYVSIGSAAIAAAAGDPIKMLSLDGIVASAETVRNGTYPISRPLHLVTKKGKEVPPHVMEIIELMKTREAADVITAQGFVTLQ